MVLLSFVYYIFLVLYLYTLIVRCVVFCVFCFIVLFYILSLCKFEMYNLHRVSTQLQLTHISYHVISNPDITPHQLSPTQLREKQCSLIFYFYLPH